MIALIGPRPHDSAEENERMSGKLTGPVSTPPTTPKRIKESSPSLGEGIETGTDNGGVAMPLASRGPPKL